MTSRHTPAQLLPDADIKDSPLSFPPAKIKQLTNLNVTTVRDLLYHLPRDYDDRSRFTPPSQAIHRERQTFRGTISAVSPHPTKRNAQTATLSDPQTGELVQLMWFGQSHLTTAVRPGALVHVTGTVFRPRYRVQITQPEIDFPDQREPVNTGRIVPIYRLTKSMTQQYLRRTMKDALDRYEPYLQRSRPGSLPGSLHQLLLQAHFPDSIDAGREALQHLANDEILELQIALIQRRRRRQQANQRPGLVIDPTPRRDFLSRLPFAPTAAQLRCIDEISHDLATQGPTMNRLLQGEVGSGKTTVAVAAAIDVASAGCKTTLLTPTEILAEQHFATICEALGAKPGPDTAHMASARLDGLRAPFSIAVLTASATARQKRTILGQAQLGIVDLLIGTHSIIQPHVQIPALALAIADEQHRFGVSQRTALRRDADYLMLTATPIPRTMQISLYRDLEVSTLDEMPPGRSPVETIPLGEQQRSTAYQAMREQIAAGHQAIIVCPLIDPAEDANTQSVNGIKQQLQQQVFPDLNIAIVHGRSTAKARDQALKQFHNGEAQILLTTAVVEAGFDEPNATVMLIESCERFGMAQMHQLRGRVGRGRHAGRCYLMVSPGHQASPDTRTRVRTVRDCNDGLTLATADLSLRGHGQLDGQRQSGRDNILRTGVNYDTETLSAQHEVANAIIASDPDLRLPQHQLLREGAQRITVRFDSADTDH